MWIHIPDWFKIQNLITKNVKIEKLANTASSSITKASNRFTSHLHSGTPWGALGRSAGVGVRVKHKGLHQRRSGINARPNREIRLFSITL